MSRGNSPSSEEVVANQVVIGGEARELQLSQPPGHALLEQEARFGPEVQAAVLAQKLREHAELGVRHLRPITAALPSILVLSPRAS